MSCCGCASRVLNLQSEIRSWKSKLGDEKREKKMILRWIMAVFGYDIQVEIDRETHGVRVEATENKEGMAKALVKLGIGRGGGVGDGEVNQKMVMELKMESHEFFEPFEDPYEVPEFPILEINSMSTQQPIVNTGIHYGHLQHHSSNPQTLSTITTPIEATPTILSTGPSDQEVLYLAGNFEEGATIEGSNGQSYILVRASEGDEMSMQFDYSNVVKEEVIDDGNLYYRLATTTPMGIESAINYLPVTQTHSSLSSVVTHPHAVPLVREADSDQMETEIDVMTETTIESPIESPAPLRKKATSSAKVIGQGSTKALKKQKSSTSEMNVKIKNVHSKSVPTTKASTSSSSSGKHKNLYSPPPPEGHSESSKPKSKQPEPTNSASKKGVFEFGLTLREKAEIYVIQKAKDAVEKVSNGYRCTVCEENRYIYSNHDTAVAHTKTHFESKKYRCEFCNELFSIQRELLKHRKTMHPKPKGAVTSISSRLTSQARASRKSNESELSTTVKPACTTADGSTSPNSQTRTIIVQAPFGKSLSGGPISISSDVLAALLGSNSSTITVASTNATQPKSVAIPVVTKVPRIIMTTGSGSNNNSFCVYPPERRATDSVIAATKSQSVSLAAFSNAQKDKSTMK
ncbi:PR domain zinc finger protein 16 [Orchesella cincta]|uniref:PR domain zinc finger protein 16 n=1 Tax=Orchesella cincta TaxID=48709 RepID=A0A1D2N450_ORCCI|nr:PR domain zinc finger protein 16 [Orchesella cincta]